MKHPRAYRPRHKSGQMNATERAYSEHLEKLRMAGEIEGWAFEVETLKLAFDTRYTPDFRVIALYENLVGMKFPIIEFHEVKGTRKKKGTTATTPFVEDDALVKLRVCAEQHPYKFILVWKGTYGWERKELN